IRLSKTGAPPPATRCARNTWTRSRRRVRRSIKRNSMEALPFSQPFMYWVGMDLDPAISPAEKDELSDFYSRVHVPEVVAANAGFVGGSRYELLDPDPRGGVHTGPRWLAAYELENEAAATTYAQRNDGPGVIQSTYSTWPESRKHLRIVWRMLWHQ